MRTTGFLLGKGSGAKSQGVLLQGWRFFACEKYDPLAPLLLAHGKTLLWGDRHTCRLPLFALRVTFGKKSAILSVSKIQKAALPLTRRTVFCIIRPWRRRWRAVRDYNEGQAQSNHLFFSIAEKTDCVKLRVQVPPKNFGGFFYGKNDKK